MKRLLLVLLIIGFASFASAAEVGLAWDANTEPGVQYRIYASRYAQEYDFTTPLMKEQLHHVQLLLMLVLNISL